MQNLAQHGNVNRVIHFLIFVLLADGWFYTILWGFFMLFASICILSGICIILRITLLHNINKRDEIATTDAAIMILAYVVMGLLIYIFKIPVWVNI